MARTILFIFGTRPEAIKLAPLIRHLRRFPGLYSVKICVSAQHRAMLDQVLVAFEIVPDFDLDVMTPDQTLYQSTSRILAALEPVFASSRPDLVIVQGDTTTTFCGALAAFYARVPVAHVEAGLRTGDLNQPFPEESNRVLTSRLATLHFAPTATAAENLADEGIVRGVSITGNTGIDAVLYIRDRLERGELPVSAPDFNFGDKRIVLVTAHRRESFGAGFEHICRALLRLAERGDVHIVYPVHPNPNVRETVQRFLARPSVEAACPQERVSVTGRPLGGAPIGSAQTIESSQPSDEAACPQERVSVTGRPLGSAQIGSAQTMESPLPSGSALFRHPATSPAFSNISLIDPLDYVAFVDLMRRCHIILTDSGGIQEEAPSLGKPVLVLREKTERPEAVEAGTVKLVGTDEDRIVREACILLDQPDEYERRSRIHNPYGDGHACERIESALRAAMNKP